VTREPASEVSQDLLVFFLALVIVALSTALLSLLNKQRRTLAHPSQPQLPWDPIISLTLGRHVAASPLVLGCMWTGISCTLALPFLITSSTGQNAWIPYITFLIGMPAAISAYAWMLRSFVGVNGTASIRTLDSKLRLATGRVWGLANLGISGFFALRAVSNEGITASFPGIMIITQRTLNMFMGLSLLSTLIWMLFYMAFRQPDPHYRRRLTDRLWLLRSSRLKNLYRSGVTLIAATGLLMLPYLGQISVTQTDAGNSAPSSPALLQSTGQLLWAILALVHTIAVAAIVAIADSHYQHSVYRLTKKIDTESLKSRLDIRTKLFGGSFASTARLVLATVLTSLLQIVNLASAIEKTEVQAATKTK